MAHWLFKSEPSAWSYEKLAGLGAAGTDWSGVRNHTAKLNMQAMKVGEQAFFYHSNEGKEIVGIVEVCKAYRPDPTDPTAKFGMVDIRAVRSLPRPVTLEEVEERQAPGQDGARHPVASLRPARHRRRMGDRLQARRPLASQARLARSGAVPGRGCNRGASSTKANERKRKEKKGNSLSFVFFLLVFGIGTFQRVTAEKSEKFFSLSDSRGGLWSNGSNSLAGRRKAGPEMDSANENTCSMPFRFWQGNAPSFGLRKLAPARVARHITRRWRSLSFAHIVPLRRFCVTPDSRQSQGRRIP